MPRSLRWPQVLRMVTGKSGHALSEIAVRQGQAKLQIDVIFTDRAATLPAIVPYPLTLDECLVCKAHHRRLLRTVADGIRIETVAEIVRCRKHADLNRTMPPQSIVVGERRRWWRPWSVGNRLERALRAGGHNVILCTHKKDSHA